MPLKASDQPIDVQAIDRFDGGVGWIAHPEETMQRASHAIATDDGVLVTDPVDGPGVDDLIEDVGEPCGVAVLFDQHARDAVAIAARHDVPIYVPEPVDVAEKLRSRGAGTGSCAQPIREVTDAIPGTNLQIRTVQNRFAWHEAALYRESDGLCCVPESVGTAAYFRASGESLGVHPMARILGPRRGLSELDPERILVGHGAGIHDDAGKALKSAISGRRRNAPSAYWNAFRAVLGG